MAKKAMENASTHAPMEVKAKIFNINLDGNPRATMSLSLNDAFVINGAKLMESGDGELFVAMPAYRQASGKYQDVCYPLTAELREGINRAGLNAYNQALGQLQGQNAAPFPAQAPPVMEAQV